MNPIHTLAYYAGRTARWALHALGAASATTPSGPSAARIAFYSSSSEADTQDENA